jgi:hypothetical protein
MLVVLGVASMLVYEPITTVAEVLSNSEPPRELIRGAMPLSIGFIVASSLAMWLLWGESLLDAVSILVTSSVVILVLGLSVSIIGLFRLTRGGAYMVVELFGLILVLNIPYAACYLVLQQGGWRNVAGATKVQV